MRMKVCRVTDRVWKMADVVQLIDARVGRTRTDKPEACRQKLE
jgi:hypothetical protein